MSGAGFHTVTLGCKLNQFDSAAIEGELSRRGMQPVADPATAAVLVLNTCTVTAKADAEARRRVRQLRRVNPDCRLLVTGCYAEREAETLRAMPGVDLVFGNRDKQRLGDLLDLLGVGQAPSDVSPATERGCEAALGLPAALHFGDRSRAFLKVQEGCRLACSYCVIPQVRGTSRSVPTAEVIEAAQALFASGYREIVLTGVNVGDYGRDLQPTTCLADLLAVLLEICGPNRVRLNSLEPLTVTDEIIELMGADPRLAPHIQVPLQSGSPVVLRAMRRNYRRSAYVERLARLRQEVPHAGIGADVIVGFPGENDTLFEETYDFIESSELNYLHVFSWSARPGTPAADLPHRVEPGEIRRRSARLRALADALALRFRRRFLGQRLDAVVLGPRRTDERLRALTGNFIEVSLDPGSASRGDLIDVIVTDSGAGGTTAEAAGRPPWATSRPISVGPPASMDLAIPLRRG